MQSQPRFSGNPFDIDGHSSNSMDEIPSLTITSPSSPTLIKQNHSPSSLSLSPSNSTCSLSSLDSISSISESPRRFSSEKRYSQQLSTEFLSPIIIPTASITKRESIQVPRGTNLSLTQEVPGLRSLRIGLGWDIRKGLIRGISGQSYDFDLDATVFMLKENGKVRDASDFIYYNNRVSRCGSVAHLGDNRRGHRSDDERDDEMVTIDLMRIPAEITKMIFAVSIHDADRRKQNFKTIKRAFIRVVDCNDHQEICRFDLSEKAGNYSALLFAEIFKYHGEWKFRPLAEGFDGGLKAMGRFFGLQMYSPSEQM